MDRETLTRVENFIVSLPDNIADILGDVVDALHEQQLELDMLRERLELLEASKVPPWMQPAPPMQDAPQMPSSQPPPVPMPRLDPLSGTAWYQLVQPKTSRTEIADPDRPGLYHVVQPSGTRSWAFRYHYNGRPRKWTIGRYPRISYEEAVALYEAGQLELSYGHDPADNVLTVKRTNRGASAGKTERGN